MIIKLMWILVSFCSAFFAGITSVLIKLGIKKTDSDIALAMRTVVILIFSIAVTTAFGTQKEIFSVNGKTWLFLILSGISTGLSWIFYFKALEKGDINKVTPVDKSSTAFTIILAVIFLKENITFLKTVWIIFIACGSYIMARNKGKEESSNHIWLIYALLSMIFASLTTIFGKIGIDGVDSGLGNAIRTGIVLIMAWIIVIIKNKLHLIKECFNKEILFIVLSGITAGASWVCFYKGLQIGVTSAVAAIDKLSIVITIIFSYIVFKEKLTFSGSLGLAMIIAGTIGLINI